MEESLKAAYDSKFGCGENRVWFSISINRIILVEIKMIINHLAKQYVAQMVKKEKAIVKCSNDSHEW